MGRRLKCVYSYMYAWYGSVCIVDILTCVCVLWILCVLWIFSLCVCIVDEETRKLAAGR